MRRTEQIARLREAVAAQGLVPQEARKRPGRAAVTLVWHRPEPVLLRADAERHRLVLDAYLPFILPGGRLHRRVRSFLVDHPAVQCTSRAGALSLATPVAPDAPPAEWAAALATLLATATALRAMLQDEWPDYAAGVFAPPLA